MFIYMKIDVRMCESCNHEPDESFSFFDTSKSLNPQVHASVIRKKYPFSLWIPLPSPVTFINEKSNEEDFKKHLYN